MLARLRDAGLERAPELRTILLGGGPIPDELFAWALGAGLPVRPTYGMTETTSQIATADVGERLARPLPGSSCASATTVRSSCAARWSRPTDGSIRATAAV